MKSGSQNLKIYSCVPAFLSLSLLLSSCAVDLPGVVREAAKDHASVHADLQFTSVYASGRFVYDRENPKPTPKAAPIPKS